MKPEIVPIPLESIAPTAEGVYSLQGIPAGAKPSQRVQDLYQEAETLFMQLAVPKGILADIDSETFAEIYTGTGKNEPQTPLESIYPQAKQLALFAATMGPEISRKVQELMENTGTDFALGFMLDSVASYSADRASAVAEEFLLKRISTESTSPKALKVLLYSPGYCGWHVSGQGKLFDYLKPQAIGITLNPSFLMTPIKSISGVLVAGLPEIHNFDNDFPFCNHCRTHNCRDRVKL